MMNVRVMRMSVDQFLVTVPMRVRFAGRVIRAVDMLMMLVVSVQVLVFHRLMPVLVFVPLSQMKPDAEAHEGSGNPDTNRQLVAQEQNRDGCAHERRGGKIRARSRLSMRQSASTNKVRLTP